jgi:hypothetical protein
MAATYSLIASTNLTSDVSSVTFSNLPTTYNHLIVKSMIQTTRRSDGYADVDFYFNSDNGSNYLAGAIRQQGNSLSYNNYTSTNTSVPWFLMASVTSGVTNYLKYFGQGEILIFNYSGTAKKVSHAKSNTTTNTAYQVRSINWGYQGTAAITSITFIDRNSANMIAGSQIYIYGIKNS